jgi:hypothetical protein
MSERIESVLFDMKQSIDDFGFEFKSLFSEFNQLKERIKLLEDKSRDA